MIKRIFLIFWIYCATLGGVLAFVNAAECMSGGSLASILVVGMAVSVFGAWEQTQW